MIPIVIIIVSVVIDQISKYIVSTNMRIGESFSFIKNIFNITYLTNKGAAFGVLKDHRWIFMIASIIAILVMLGILVHFIKRKEFLWLQIALALMVSGGIGNMIDRLYRGYVVDFLEFDFVNFAIFNVADSCVTIGCAICIIFTIVKRNEIFSDTANNDENENKNEKINIGDEL